MAFETDQLVHLIIQDIKGGGAKRGEGRKRKKVFLRRVPHSIFSPIEFHRWAFSSACAHQRRVYGNHVSPWMIKIRNNLPHRGISFHGPESAPAHHQASSAAFASISRTCVHTFHGSEERIRSWQYAWSADLPGGSLATAPEPPCIHRKMQS